MMPGWVVALSLASMVPCLFLLDWVHTKLRRQRTRVLRHRLQRRRTARQAASERRQIAEAMFPLLEVTTAEYRWQRAQAIHQQAQDDFKAARRQYKQELAAEKDLRRRQKEAAELVDDYTRVRMRADLQHHNRPDVQAVNEVKRATS